MAFLKVKFGDGSEQEIRLGDEDLTLGRSDDNGCPLKDQAASRHHAVVSASGDHYEVRDLGSSNGTWVNQKKIESHRLADGDKVTIGSTTLEYHEPEAAEATVMMDVEMVRKHQAEAQRQAAAAPPPAAPAAPAQPAPPATPPVQPVPPATPPVAASPPPMPPAVPQSPPPAAATAPSGSSSAARPAGGGGVLAKVPAPVRQWLTLPPESPAPTGEVAGFPIRLGAYLIDAVIVTLGLMVLILPLSLVAGFFASRVGFIAVLISLFIWLLSMVAPIGYFVLFWAREGATPGKKILRLRVVRDDGIDPVGFKTAALRLVGYLASGIIFYIGFLMILFTEDRKGLHDRIAKTGVIRL
jgi:uncharacterized RDD family membrane protein YckC